MNIITFSGIDCSGKSTQISMLAKYFEESNTRFVCLWYRPGYSSHLDFLRKMIRRCFPKAMPSKNDPVAREKILSKSSVGRAWLYMALLDSLFHYVVKLRVYSIRGITVICDRYVHDSIIDLELRFPQFDVRASILKKMLAVLAPDPAAQFLLLLPKEEMLRRMEIKKEPFPDSASLRDQRYEKYASLKDHPSFLSLDATEAIDALHKRILAALA